MPTGDPNVVLIANPGADLYGSDRMVLETVRGLVGAGRRVVVTVPHTGPLVPLLEDAGAEVVECATPIVRKGLLNARGLVELVVTSIRSVGPGLRLIRRVDPGAVIVNTITPPLWILLGRISRRLTVCHVHEGEGSVAGIVRRALYLPLVFTNRVIANSDFTRRVLATSAPRVADRTVVVHNAVPGADAIETPRDTLTAPTRLLYVGRLSHRKGVHVAIDALDVLVREGRDVRLDVVGAVFPGNEAYLAELHAQVSRCALDDLGSGFLEQRHEGPCHGYGHHDPPPRADERADGLENHPIRAVQVGAGVGDQDDVRVTLRHVSAEASTRRPGSPSMRCSHGWMRRRRSTRGSAARSPTRWLREAGSRHSHTPTSRRHGTGASPWRHGTPRLRRTCGTPAC
jgi:glycosyltransferase involved in cell wall biosynthesis